MQWRDDQPWMRAETEPHWQEFIRLSHEEREAALEHTLRISSSSVGAGWQDVTVTLDGRRASYHISTWLGSDYNEFVQTVVEMSPREDMHYAWAQEPGSHPWHLSRRYDYIYVAPPNLDGAIMRWSALLEALDCETICEERSWWQCSGVAARDEEDNSDWVGDFLDSLQEQAQSGAEYDWEVSAERRPEGVGWHGEAWETLIVTIGPTLSDYCDAGIDQLAEAIAQLDPNGDSVQLWGRSRPWAHGWFIRRQGSFVTVESPLLRNSYGEWVLCYEDLRQALCGGASNGEAVRTAVRRWVRFWNQADPLLSEYEDNYWSTYDAQPEEVRRQAIGRYRLGKVAYESLGAGPSCADTELARLVCCLEDTVRTDYQEELWMRALSAEDLDEQERALVDYQAFVLEPDPQLWLDAPRRVLEALVEEVRGLEDGACLLVGGDDGVRPRCSDGSDLLISEEGRPSRHRWLIARHGEVVLLDSTLLDQEIVVSRASLLGAL